MFRSGPVSGRSRKAPGGHDLPRYGTIAPADWPGRADGGR